MIKKEIRPFYLAKRLGLSPEEKASSEADILRLVRADVRIPKRSFFLSYLPIASKAEMNTHDINQYLVETFDAKLCYPKMQGERFVPICVGESPLTVVTSGRYNIPEPQYGNEIDAHQLSLVIAPLLAFDEEGFRVGYGKGMYDTFFERVSSTCVKMGCSFFPAIEKIEDRNPPFDKKLDFVITPTKTYYF